jgi:two-component system alkaline phosphatase synthesis response regulator PhoP
VEALLRRVQKENLTPVKSFEFGDVEADFEKAIVRKAGRELSLTGKEMQLLRYLVDHRGKPVSREELLESVWEYQQGVSSRTVDVHIAWLRQKIEDNVQQPRFIHTVRGVGYRFAA